MTRTTAKTLSLILAAALTLGLGACGSEKEKPAEQEEKPRTGINDQIELIYENRNGWLTGNDETVYCVTDLDRNGRLELISATLRESGGFSENVFWEVGEDYKSLRKLRAPAYENASEPDLSEQSAMRCYFTEDGRISYVTEDIIVEEDANISFVKTGLSLSEGKLEARSLGHIETFAANDKLGNIDIYAGYYGPEGFNVNSLQFSAIENDAYGETLSRATVATFGWFREKDNADLQRLMADSYDGFGFDDDYGDIASLFRGPEDYFGGYKIQELSGTGDDGKGEDPFEAYEGSWKLIGEWLAETIEIEGYREYCVESGVRCWVIFRDDMTCDFVYDPPEDYEDYPIEEDPVETGEEQASEAQESEAAGETAEGGEAAEEAPGSEGGEPAAEEPEEERKPEFYGMSFEFVKGAMYYGCPNQDWYIMFEGSEEDTFKATMTDQFTVEILWYHGPWSAEDYPEVIDIICVSNY